MKFKQQAIQQKPQRLFFRIYPTFIEAAKEQLKIVNRQSYYRISVWQGDVLLGDMMEGASPAVLADKIFLTKALVNFSQEMTPNGVTLKLTEHFEDDRVLGEGKFDLQAVKTKYVEQSQRFHSLQTAFLNTQYGALKLVFSIFVQRDKHELDQYIRRFKENERKVIRARRNINNYKKEMMHRIQQRQKQTFKQPSRHQNDLIGIIEAKEDSSIEKEECTYLFPNNDQSEMKVSFLMKQRVREADDFSLGSAPPGTYLQIDSAAKFHKKRFDKNVSGLKTLNQAEEKEFQAYANVIEEFRSNSHLASVFDLGTTSLISDGSEESEMRLHDEFETYSEKAVKKFRANLSRFLNLGLVVVAILMIYLVLAPSKKGGKARMTAKKPHRAGRSQL